MTKESKLANKVLELCEGKKEDVEVSKAFNEYQHYLIKKKGYDKQLHLKVLETYVDYKVWFYVKEGGSKSF